MESSILLGGLHSFRRMGQLAGKTLSGDWFRQLSTMGGIVARYRIGTLVGFMLAWSTIFGLLPGVAGQTKPGGTATPEAAKMGPLEEYGALLYQMKELHDRGRY